MLSTEDLKLLRAIASAASLAEASRALDVSASAVSQRLSTIEAKLGARLVERGKSKLVLTADGSLVAEKALAVLAGIDDIESAVISRRNELRGHIRVLAPFGFGRRHVAPALLAFRGRYPAVSFDLRLTEKTSTAVISGIDLVVNIGPVGRSTRVAIKLAPNGRYLCGAPSYFARRGIPRTMADLAHHDCLVLREEADDATMWRAQVNGRTVAVRIRPTMASNDGEVLREWALSGAGIIMRSEWDVAETLRAGTLQRVLPECRLQRSDITALVNSRKELNDRTRAFIGFLRERLNPPPWRLDNGN